MSKSLFGTFLQDYLIIIFGSILGSSCRFYLMEYFQLFSKRKYFATFLVNLIATILLSICVFAYQNYYPISSNMSLFLLVGFLGSLSTFSTFIIDVLNSFLHDSWFEGVYILALSIIGTFIAGYLCILIFT